MSERLLERDTEITTATYVVHLPFSDENDNPESEEVNEKLEEIDDETDNLDITFVKMADPRYARKWGVTKLPAIVYFRKRFPSIYRGKRILRGVRETSRGVLTFVSMSIAR